LGHPKIIRLFQKVLDVFWGQLSSTKPRAKNGQMSRQFWVGD
jgi:hypothetical protein